MTDRDRLILEEPEKMCEYCCNFDKEHIGMDCTALCKLTMTLAYAEDYGGNCMFYNVPKERIIVPPCYIGQMVYQLYEKYNGDSIIRQGKVSAIQQKADKSWKIRITHNSSVWDFKTDDIGVRYFLTKEEAEQALAERSGNNGLPV